MLKIKLTRIGKKGQPQYRIVVIEARDKNRGKYIELLGTYNPLVKPATMTMELAKYNAWLAKGAQPTDTVRKLVAYQSKSK